MNIGLSALSCDDATGIGRIVLALAKEFSRTGNDVTVIAQSIGSLPERCREQRCFKLPLSRGASRALFNLQTSRLHARCSFDVTNSFGVGRGAMVVTAQSCHRAGVEFQSLVTPQRIRTRGLGLFDRVALADEKSLMTAASTRLIIAVSSLVREQLAHWYGIPHESIEVVPNGISPERFQSVTPAVREKLRNQAECSPSDFLLLFVGNEFDRKGLETVIEAVALLRETPLKVLIIGDDDPSPYRRRASALGVGTKLRFLGRVEGPEPWYAAADAFVLPTWYEPFGMVIIEAMAAGLPVITSATAGAVETFTDGKEGLFIHDRFSAEELAGAVLRISQDENLRQALSAAGKTAAGKFSWQDVAARTLDLYHLVIAGGNGHG